MRWAKYHWQQNGTEQRPGGWEVERVQGGACVDVTDCGCCGSVTVLEVVDSVEAFDAWWHEQGLILRERVAEALDVEGEE